MAWKRHRSSTQTFSKFRKASSGAEYRVVGKKYPELERIRWMLLSTVSEDRKQKRERKKTAQDSGICPQNLLRSLVLFCPAFRDLHQKSQSLDWSSWQQGEDVSHDSINVMEVVLCEPFPAQIEPFCSFMQGTEDVSLATLCAILIACVLED